MPRRLFACVVLVFQLIPYLLLGGDSVQFEHLTVNNGLAQNSVECIFQDRAGYMWFGTAGGLSRYDGYGFQNYIYSPLDTQSISSNMILSIFETNDFLWIGTIENLNLLNKKDQTFSSLPIQAVNSIASDGQGHLWSGSLNHGLFRIDTSAKKWQAFTSRNSGLEDSVIYSLLLDPDGILWIATSSHGVYGAEYDSGKLAIKYHWNKISDSGSPVPPNISDLAMDKQGNLWIATRHKGLICRSPDGHFRSIRHNPKIKNGLPENEIWRLYYDDPKNVLWIGLHNKGLCRLDLNSWPELKFSSITHHTKLPGSLGNNFVKSIFRDFSGNLWVGTHNGGVNKLVEPKIHFHVLPHEPERPAFTAENQVWSFGAEHGDSLWIGTGKGLLLLDGDKIVDSYRLKPPPSPLTNYQVRSIVPAEGHKLWLAILNLGLFQYDYVRRLLKPVKWRHPKLNYYERNFYSLLDGGKDYLWLGSNTGGLVRFNKRTRNFRTFNINGEPRINPTNLGWVISIHADSTGNLWLGTWKEGLIKFDPFSGKMTRFTTENNRRTSINNNTVFCIHQSEAQKNIFWLGTYGGGLNRMDTIRKTFSHFTTRDGLCNDIVYGIVEDRFHHLWLATNNGLSCFDPRLKSFKTYTTEDGLPSIEFNLGACYKNRKGRIFFGTPAGFVYFDPIDIVNRIPPKVMLTGFKKYGQPVALNSVFLKNPVIKISSRDKVISFQFTALHFKDPAKNHYAYLLEGFDNHWIDSGTQREAVYTNLPPGKYVFRVRAANCDGVWNRNGLSVTLNVMPPFWKTSWFIISALGFIALFLFSGYRLHVKRLLKIEKTKMEEREQLRRKMAADFHDELGHRVTKISLLSKIALNQTARDSKPVETFLKQIAENADGLFFEMKEFVWELDPEKDSLYDLMSQLKNFSGYLFDNTEIAFQIEGLTPDLESLKLNMDWRKHLLRIFKEGLHNILKHAGNCRSVSLKIAHSDHKLTIELSDDGAGFDLNQMSDGHGLRNMRERAKKIGGILRILTAPGQGTKIIFEAELP